MLAISIGGLVVVVLGLTFAVMLYLLPLVIASVRGAPDFGLILVSNLFLGTTLIGWAIALYMAFRPVPSRPA